MAARKTVDDNHTVTTAPDGSELEQLLEQQEPGVSGKEDIESEAAPKEEAASETQAEEKSEKPNASAVVLKKAATFYGRGMRFVKNAPVPVDEEMRQYLLGTGLFEGV